MKNPILLISLLAISLTSCQNQPEVNTISGKIENSDQGSINLIGYANGQADTLRRSVLDASGNFSMEFKAGKSDFYTLSLSEESSLVLILDSTDTDVVVKGDANKMRETYDVSGSDESERLRDLLVETSGYEKQLDSLMTALRTAAGSNENEKRVELGKSYNEARKAYREYLLGFINQDPDNLANFTALQRLDMKEDLPHFITVRDSLSERMRGNYFFDGLSEQIAKTERQARLENLLKPGSEAPEIALPNPEGEMKRLSDLRGNYVLIDFWAAWCKPCRRENPNVVRLYDKYQNENFEVFGVSLDKTKDKWVKAIADDNLRWTQVSDLKYWQSDAAKLYNVKSIPFTVLIDPDGNVIATRLRGAALEQKLDEIFNA